jgi:hypothetical protein
VEKQKQAAAAESVSVAPTIISLTLASEVNYQITLRVRARNP